MRPSLESLRQSELTAAPLIGWLNHDLRLRIGEQTGSLKEYVDPAYHLSLAAWLNDVWEETHAQVILPLHSDTSAQAAWHWVKLSLGQRSDAMTERPLILTSVEGVLQAHLLAAKTSNFIGFQHDLANRLFLFKALPQLIEFSSPAELVADINTELPHLISFIEDRLSPEWTDSLKLQSIDQPTALLDHLSQYTSCQVNEGDQPLPERMHFVPLGLDWAMTQFTQRLKRGELPDIDKTSSIRLMIGSAPSFPLGTVGACGKLLVDQPLIQLTLELPGLQSEQWKDWWMNKRHWHISQSGPLSKRPQNEEVAASCFSAWVNAAHLTRGIVTLGHNQLHIIC